MNELPLPLLWSFSKGEFQSISVNAPKILPNSDLIIINVGPLLSHFKWKTEAKNPSLLPLYNNLNPLTLSIFNFLILNGKL